ncbi:MAG: class I SAM-dependent methyltransferase [Alphaproteobacteria bacterium]|nr:class I SAM-dependent methyltransferase [Alphaproteobacteria bacterium]
MLQALKPAAKYVLNSAIFALPAATRQRYKEFHELRYWKSVTTPIADDRAMLEHERSHYEFFFTTFFGLTHADYAGKRILDVGCGPRGSLEWADMTAERVGVDPLADKYRALCDDRQKMTYRCAPSEAIPFPDGYFDSVSTFNSLDHVDDVDATIAELKRVTKSSGRILVIVEIGHAPTPTEPHFLDENLVTRFAPFKPVGVRLFGVRADHNLYGSMHDKVPYVKGEEGILAARLEG